MRRLPTSRPGPMAPTITRTVRPVRTPSPPDRRGRVVPEPTGPARGPWRAWGPTRAWPGGVAARDGHPAGPSPPSRHLREVPGRLVLERKVAQVRPDAPPEDAVVEPLRARRVGRVQALLALEALVTPPPLGGRAKARISALVGTTVAGVVA